MDGWGGVVVRSLKVDCREGISSVLESTARRFGYMYGECRLW